MKVIHALDFLVLSLGLFGAIFFVLAFLLDVPPFIAVGAGLVPLVIFFCALYANPRLMFSYAKKRDRAHSAYYQAESKEGESFKQFVKFVSACVATRPGMTVQVTRDYHGAHPYLVVVEDRSSLANPKDYKLRVVEGKPFLMTDDGELLIHSYESQSKKSLLDDDGNVMVTDPAALEMIRNTE